MTTENERLRILDLVNRYKVLKEQDAGFPGTRAHLKSIGQEVPNLAMFLKEKILNNPNHAQAEQRMALMEEKEAEYQAAKIAEVASELEVTNEAKQAWVELKQSNNADVQRVVKVIKQLVKMMKYEE